MGIVCYWNGIRYTTNAIKSVITINKIWIQKLVKVKILI